MKIQVINKDINKEMLARVIRLDITYIEAILELQSEIMTALEDKSLFSPSDREEYLSKLKGDGVVIGVVLEENNQLIAYGVFCKPGNIDSNYGHDIGLSETDLMEVGHIESTIVKVSYRGNRLQKLICNELERVAREGNVKILCATASPLNLYSVKTFTDLGYEIKKEKLKYGGLRRYVLVKNI